ncbi:MAG: glycoside hydrolase family 44 protein [Anaerolineae bacterium]|nr:glycoside hydrolase family 44 protein [Anaerolineae bacterium]
MNFADEDLASDLNLPVRRWGGNATSRYNWELDVHNTGSDWYFENISGDPDNTQINKFVEQDRRTGTQTILTIPLLGWTPKRLKPDHPFDCGFPVSVYGQQQSVDEWDSNCGNGQYPDGTPITDTDPSLTSMPITTDFLTEAIGRLHELYGTAGTGGVIFFNLDNEPMLWNSTHRDIHPAPASYDEMRDSTYMYAAALKAADPAAQTLGPVAWGWCAYFYSAVDDCGANSTDFASHGNMHFTPWYLQQMQAYEQQYGVRILDYLDLHYYPQAKGVALASAGDESTQALRLRSTRALWDPTYADESWITDVRDGPYVRLIPRMKEWVDANYPGTRLAITEYNWGALDHINGALAQADVLGIFGREGLDLATLWSPPDLGQPGSFAFRMYLNYDGQDHTFGETSIQGASTDQEKLAIYAALRQQDGALTLMIINKTKQTLTSQVSLAGLSPSGVAEVYRYSANNLTAIVREADQSVTTDGFNGTFPAESITLVVIPAAGG